MNEDWRMMYESILAEYLDFKLPHFIPRTSCKLALHKPAQNNLISVLVGVRRSGKTFYLYQLVAELLKKGIARETILHLSLDDDRFRPYKEHMLSTLLDEYFAMVPKAKEGCYLFLDEIQEVPNWESFIRRIQEHYPITIVLTGSSSKLLSKEISTLLRGRALAYEMWPLSFKEFLQFHAIEEPASHLMTKANELKLKKAFNNYLTIGGFPAIQFLDPLSRIKMLQTYAEQIVTKDIVERFNTSSIWLAERFSLNALRSTGLVFSVNNEVKTLRGLGMPGNAAKLYELLDDFEDANLIFHIANYHLSIKENPKAAYKVYSVDSGLSLAVAPASHLDIGQRLETVIFVELKRRLQGMRDRVIARYVTSTCPEVDFIVGDVHLVQDYALIQVAAIDSIDSLSEKKRKAELGNLETAMKETGLSQSWLITFGQDQDIQVSSGLIHVISAWRFLCDDSVLGIS